MELEALAGHAEPAAQSRKSRRVVFLVFHQKGPAGERETMEDAFGVLFLTSRWGSRGKSSGYFSSERLGVDSFSMAGRWLVSSRGVGQQSGMGLSAAGQ